MPQCGSRYLDRRWRSQRQRAAGPAARARGGDAWSQRCWAGRWRRHWAPGRPRHRMPVRRAAGPPMAPAISRPMTGRAARSSCSAASKAASAAANRAGADRGYPVAAPHWPRSDAARADLARRRHIRPTVTSARTASGRAISGSFSSRRSRHAGLSAAPWRACVRARGRDRRMPTPAAGRPPSSPPQSPARGPSMLASRPAEMRFGHCARGAVFCCDAVRQGNNGTTRRWQWRGRWLAAILSIEPEPRWSRKRPCHA